MQTESDDGRGEWADEREQCEERGHGWVGWAEAEGWEMKRARATTWAVAAQLRAAAPPLARRLSILPVHTQSLEFARTERWAALPRQHARCPSPRHSTRAWPEAGSCEALARPRRLDDDTTGPSTASMSLEERAG